MKEKKDFVLSLKITLEEKDKVNKLKNLYKIDVNKMIRCYLTDLLKELENGNR